MWTVKHADKTPIHTKYFLIRHLKGKIFWQTIKGWVFTEGRHTLSGEFIAKKFTPTYNRNTHTPIFPNA